MEKTIDTTEMVYEDLAPVTVPVKIGKKKYLLREASEGAASEYKNCMTRSTVFNLEGKPTHVDGIHNAEALLVSLCLFELFGDPEKERPVILSTVRSWPHERVQSLFKRAREISKLDRRGDVKDEDGPEKNDLPAGTTTSDSPTS